MENSTFLKKMAESSYERVAKAKLIESEFKLSKAAKESIAPPLIYKNYFNIIAEIKKRSPANGMLGSANFDLESQLKSYASAKPLAVSILTESEKFKGSLDDLSVASKIMKEYNIPVMRKDFLVDPYQLLEAKKLGASGALLIASILSDDQLDTLLACAAENDLFILLESFDYHDIEKINKCALDKYINRGCSILSGVNCRNLKNLAIDFERFKELSSLLPEQTIKVAESGIEKKEHVKKIVGLGYSVALIGSILMKSPNPEQLLKDLIKTGRSEVEVIKDCS
tara:strand:+ start:369 stop:1217 length:849 start_codon:yes stop_codon:yes gene_type:complete